MPRPPASSAGRRWAAWRPGRAGLLLVRRAAPPPVTTLAFVALVAGGLLAGLFQPIYGTPLPGLKLASWASSCDPSGGLAVLSMARIEVRGFGFLPDRREWAARLRQLRPLLPLGALLGWMLKFSQFHLRPGAWWQTAASAR